MVGGVGLVWCGLVSYSSMAMRVGLVSWCETRHSETQKGEKRDVTT